MRLAGVKVKQHFRKYGGHVRSLIISYDQPILVRALVETTENLAPGKFPLTGEF